MIPTLSWADNNSGICDNAWGASPGVDLGKEQQQNKKSQSPWVDQ